MGRAPLEPMKTECAFCGGTGSRTYSHGGVPIECWHCDGKGMATVYGANRYKPQPKALGPVAAGAGPCDSEVDLGDRVIEPRDRNKNSTTAGFGFKAPYEYFRPRKWRRAFLTMCMFYFSDIWHKSTKWVSDSEVGKSQTGGTVHHINYEGDYGDV